MPVREIDQIDCHHQTKPDQSPESSNSLSTRWHPLTSLVLSTAGNEFSIPPSPQLTIGHSQRTHCFNSTSRPQRRVGLKKTISLETSLAEYVSTTLMPSACYKFLSAVPNLKQYFSARVPQWLSHCTLWADEVRTVHMME
jgi:hypothetical protein